MSVTPGIVLQLVSRRAPGEVEGGLRDRLYRQLREARFGDGVECLRELSRLFYLLLLALNCFQFV